MTAPQLLCFLFFQITIKSFTGVLERLGNDQAWIGAHKNFGDWQYDGLVNGKMVASDWEAYKPDLEIEKCVTTRIWGRWNNIPCDWHFSYVCERWRQ